MNIVAYGGGTDSTAMLIECVIRGIIIDLILFADTGGEKPHTYEYIKLFNKWLIDHGMPEIIKVRVESRTLEEDCLIRNALPSVAYGFKTCSQRFKLDPQKKYVNNFAPAKEEWANGRKIIKFIGYDADEPQRAKDYEDKKYINRYPLIEWDIGRDKCLEIIKEAGLPLPGKSACYFCPSSKPHEIKNLKLEYPELAERAIQMEENADLTSVIGLGRSFSWKSLLATEDIFDGELNDALRYEADSIIVDEKGKPFRVMVDAPCGCYDG